MVTADMVMKVTAVMATKAMVDMATKVTAVMVTKVMVDMATEVVADIITGMYTFSLHHWIHF